MLLEIRKDWGLIYYVHTMYVKLNFFWNNRFGVNELVNIWLTKDLVSCYPECPFFYSKAYAKFLDFDKFYIFISKKILFFDDSSFQRNAKNEN